MGLTPQEFWESTENEIIARLVHYNQEKRILLETAWATGISTANFGPFVKRPKSFDQLFPRPKKKMRLSEKLDMVEQLGSCNIPIPPKIKEV